ncbi:TetR/AcrR family transcriptional regulator [Frankia nepalensis]|uniref:TetR/AcrR family transcriptional regulator n=1 Tax=Frankia nepalensis TaxID=1836974 RepID=A0A937RJJ7_9ACTN|nr:TetR/AcrR family transcriptional regulator [Frankia nepalensis]MBL7496560.1 TetR/AcrR family transcriptional regulator [Frankia nepalensis]MBL7508779.1 TetR/AcrR family transcriptional regulator [Frankia nepalensis]MBL7627533.1 TetR/AcrR family transcriptional regulator [Frankia nepalensis]
MAEQAAALASVHGLSGLTLSEVAGALGVSKSSVQAAYATKEAVQLAAVAAATDVFVAEVVAPAHAQPEGLPRLSALIEAWFDYVERRVFPGGCFMVATLADFDSRPGPVRDALAASRQRWLDLLERDAAIAQSAGHLPSSPPAAMLAFEIDALLAAANVSRNLSDTTEPLALARSLIALRLGTTADTRPPDMPPSGASSPDTPPPSAPSGASSDDVGPRVGRTA